MNSSNRTWRILELVNFGLDAFIVFFLIAGPWIAAPDFLQVLGRAHPLILHFPIVFIVLFPLLPWILSSMSIPADSGRLYLRRYLRIAHLAGALTVLFGLILALEDGYASREVDLHKWGGVLVLLSIIILQNSPIVRTRPRKSSSIFLGIPAVILVITSHIGSGITHGQGFLTEPIAKKPPIVPLDQARVFEDIIHPILDQKCMNCHNTSKSKGGLVLEDSTSLAQGGEGGAVLLAGNAGESRLFQRLLLDIDHDDHMPPKGKPQLTPQEIQLIGEWISQPNLFDLAYHSLNPSDTLSILIRENYGSEEGPVFDMKPARKSVIRELNDNYRLLQPIASESPALYARFLSRRHFQDEHLEALTRAREQIVDLYLAYMPIGDEALSTVGKFQNLQVLNLNGTAVTDAGIKELYGLKDLQKLHLTGTGVTTEGIRDLLNAIAVKTIYVWDTPIDSIATKSLTHDYPGTTIIGESNSFGDEIIALNSAQIKPESSFFENALDIIIDHPIPEVDIRYTLDGSEPDSLSSLQYEGPLEIQDNIHLKIKAFKSGWISSPVVEKSYFPTKHTPDSIWFVTQPNPNFTGDGPSTVVNLQAGDRVHEDNNYLAYRESDGVMGFSFSEKIPLQKVVLSGLIKTPSYIFPPSSVEIEAWVDDSWLPVRTETPAQPTDQVDFDKFSITLKVDQPLNTDQVRITFSPVKSLPQWHPGKGDQGWVFVDEVLFQ